MDVGTIANVATAAAVITGLVFGIIEIVHARRERGAFEVVHAMLTPEWMRSMAIVQSLPDGVPAADLEADPNKLEAAESVGIILETLGYSVYRRIVPLLVVDDLIGGTVRIAFRKMRGYIEYDRARV